MGLESIHPPKPFQAEYEGSIPFTRSKLFNGVFQDLCHGRVAHRLHGSAYGLAGHFRISISTDDTVIERGCDAIAAVCRKLT
jgi:hypothetical protein